LVLSLIACAAVPAAKPKPAARLDLGRPRWLAVERLQGSGIALAGSEIWVVNDRSGRDANTIEVFDRRAFARADTLEPVRQIVLDVRNPAIADPVKRKYYEARVCRGSCDQLDIEDLALDASGAIYVSVEGRADAVVKFDPKTLRAVDLWPSVTGDHANLGPEGLAVTRDGSLIFVGRQKPAQVSVIDTRTRWVSSGPVDAVEINGLAYDAARRHLLVLDTTVPEVIRMTTSGRILARYAIERDAVVDPSGGKFEGLSLDGIALDPSGRWLWLVTDPPHESGDRYGPAARDASPHYEKGYSMLFRAPLARLRP
jgi:DNA-binding beta-propeller fold protein YncE